MRARNSSGTTPIRRHRDLTTFAEGRGVTAGSSSRLSTRHNIVRFTARENTYHGSWKRDSSAVHATIVKHLLCSGIRICYGANSLEVVAEVARAVTLQKTRGQLPYLSKHRGRRASRDKPESCGLIGGLCPLLASPWPCVSNFISGSLFCSWLAEDAGGRSCIINPQRPCNRSEYE